MQKLRAIIEITRPVNIIITFLVVIVAATISGTSFQININVILASISASLVAASGNMINDYFDLEIDRINKPERPLPSGRLSQKEVLLLFIFTSITAIYISSFISLPALILVVTTIILLIIYSLRLKSFPLVGNIVVSLCTGLAFIYGGIAIGNYKNAVIPALFAFLINLIRELIKDIEDMDGDTENGLSTFPIKYGINNTKHLITIVITLLIISTFYPFIIQYYNIEYFIIVLFFVDLPLIYLIKNIYSMDFLSKLSTLSFKLKILMIFGLVAIFAGKF